MSDIVRDLFRRTASGTYEHDRVIRDFLAAVRAGIAEGTERALRPAAHPLIGRRAQTPEGREGEIESVRDAIAVVRFDDGTAYTNGTAYLVLRPEASR